MLPVPYKEVSIPALQYDSTMCDRIRLSLYVHGENMVSLPPQHHKTLLSVCACLSSVDATVQTHCVALLESFW